MAVSFMTGSLSFASAGLSVWGPRRTRLARDEPPAHPPGRRDLAGRFVLLKRRKVVPSVGRVRLEPNLELVFQ